MPKPSASKRKSVYVDDQALDTKRNAKTKKRLKKATVESEGESEPFDDTTDISEDEKESMCKPRKKVTKKKQISNEPLVMDPNAAVESEEEEETQPTTSASDVHFVPSGILDKKKYKTTAIALRKEASTASLNMPMHYFPHIQVGKSTYFAARFSPENGKSHFYLWKGRKNDDLENMKQVFKLSETGFSNMLRSKEDFLKWTTEIELFRQKCEAGVIKEAARETLTPILPDPVILENTSKGVVQMVGYTYSTGIGGGVSIRYMGNIGETAANPIGFTPLQFCVLMESYLPLVQNISNAVEHMFAEIREKENVRDIAGPSDYWKTA
jgi:hypothetical protein